MGLDNNEGLQLIKEMISRLNNYNRETISHLLAILFYLQSKGLIDTIHPSADRMEVINQKLVDFIISWLLTKDFIPLFFSSEKLNNNTLTLLLYRLENHLKTPV